MSQTRGFYTGGTVHVVINNQIGFTTSRPRDARSTLYCTDVAQDGRGAGAARERRRSRGGACSRRELALDFRQRFRKDVVIDIVCYRRHGHNEADEPAVTQPLMYKKIAQHPSTRELYADKLVAAGRDRAPTSRSAMVEALPRRAGRGQAHRAHAVLANCKRKFAVDWTPFLDAQVDRRRRHARAASRELDALGRARSRRCPTDFKLHPRVAKVDRRPRARWPPARSPIDWGFAENLALRVAGRRAATRVRLSARTAGRGTFSHRHAVLHDQNREKRDTAPTCRCSTSRDGQAPFDDHRLAAVRGSGARLRVRLRDRRARRAGRSGKRSSATSPTARRS